MYVPGDQCPLITIGKMYVMCTSLEHKKKKKKRIFIFIFALRKRIIMYYVYSRSKILLFA